MNPEYTRILYKPNFKSVSHLYSHKQYNYNGTEKTYIYNNKYKMDINICTIYTAETEL